MVIMDGDNEECKDCDNDSDNDSDNDGFGYELF